MALHQPAHHVGLACGRNAEPTSWVCFTEISRSMMSPRAISRLWTCSSIASISLRSTASEAERGVPWTCHTLTAGQPDAVRQIRPLMRKTAAESKEKRQRLTVAALVNHGLP